jgi:hypothetical protein
VGTDSRLLRWNQSCLVLEKASMTTITCPYCGYTSHNPNDVEQKYCGNCQKFHSDLSTDLPLWAWSVNSDSLWAEDDATCYLPDHEGLNTAWKRLFGKDRSDETPLVKYVDGDCDYYLYSDNRVACSSYPGNSDIRRVKPRATWQRT